MNPPFKRIYRSRIEVQAAGVCGGLGIYFGIDPVVIRLGVMLATLITGIVPGLVAYLAAWVIMPLEPLPDPVQPAATGHQGEPA